MGIKVRQGPRERCTTVEVISAPLFTPEQAERMLRGTMRLVSINPTPGLIERWARGQVEAGVVCPECSGNWQTWVDREKRRKEEGRLPWENS